MVEERKVPEGYKMTEVGVIPEDWKIVPLENVVDKGVKWSLTGGPFGSNLKSSDYTLDGVRIIQLQNIGDGVFNDDYKIYTSQKKADELISCNIYPHEIIMSKMGDPVARACIVPDSSERYLMCSDGIRLVVDEKRFSKMFVYHFINSKYFRERAIEASTGSTRQRIGLNKLRKLLIISPPLPEQQAIAEALSDVDNLITSLEKLIDKKQKIKQGTMQELLTGRKRLPGFTGKWEKKKVKEFGEVVTGGTPSTVVKEFWNGTIPWVTPTDISNRKEIYDTERKITELGLNRLRKLPADSVLITCIASIGKNAILKIAGACNQQINAIISYNNYDSDFLYYLFENNKKYLVNNAGITATNIISKKDFSELEFKVPMLEEQQAIAKILSDMDAEIEALEQKLEKYKAIKQGMMQELLTGRIRLV